MLDAGYRILDKKRNDFFYLASSIQYPASRSLVGLPVLGLCDEASLLPLANLHGLRILDPLDDLLSQQAIGTDHQDEHQNDKGGHILESGENWIQVSPCQVLKNANDESTQDGTPDTVQPTEDDHREDPKPNEAQVRMDSTNISDELGWIPLIFPMTIPAMAAAQAAKLHDNAKIILALIPIDCATC
jgi:hypothetical protein